MINAEHNGRHVLIVQEHLPHYRVAFFEQLRCLLHERGISLDLVYSAGGTSKLLPGSLPWARAAPTARWRGLVYQHVMGRAAKADLVIVPQELKYISLAWLLARRAAGLVRLAFWGHGRNMQSRNQNSWPERVKRILSKRVDWWFAYNERSAAVVRELGFPADRITIVQNAINTKHLVEARRALTQEAIETAKTSLGIHSSNVAIYTGGLYEEKRLPFLLEAAAKVHAQMSDFHLIIIGGGPQGHLIIEAARNNSWVHYLGPKNDTEKLPFWAISKISLMPGLVGLGVLDSFSLGVPLITTNYPYHSPEIEYLRDGVNGVMVHDWKDTNAYAKNVIALLKDQNRLAHMITEGDRAAHFYTIENMAVNFASGIIEALSRNDTVQSTRTAPEGTIPSVEAD